MKFFVPAAKDEAKAEHVYTSIANSLKAPITPKRIWQLRWNNNLRDITCEVGKPLASDYQTGKELVLAIFDCENFYKICTLTRGGFEGEPILVEKNSQSSVTYFVDKCK